MKIALEKKDIRLAYDITINGSTRELTSKLSQYGAIQFVWQSSVHLVCQWLSKYKKMLCF